MSRWIRQIQRQQGLSTEVVPFGNEYLTLHECRPFHSIFIDSHMDLTIRFQLVPQMPGYFRIRDANTADKVSTLLENHPYVFIMFYFNLLSIYG